MFVLVKRITIALMFGLVVALPSQAQETEDCVKVGYHQFPCIVVNDDATGTLSGLAVDILDRVGTEAGQEFCLSEYAEFDKVFPSVAEAEVDMMVGALTITGQREAMVDFTMPFMNAGLGILVKVGTTSGVGTIAKAIMTPVVGQTLVFFIVFLLVAGFILWLAERGEEAGIPDGFEGYIQACYCAFDIASTVGFGRVEPRRILGRLVAIPVFVAGAIFVGTLIGSVSSALTVAGLDTVISSPSELRGQVVATKAGSSSEHLLKTLGAQVVTTQTREEAVELLRSDHAVAVVYDSPFLQFIASRDAGLVVSDTFALQYYGFALPEGSALREPINSVLLKMQQDGSLGEIIERYFGD